NRDDVGTVIFCTSQSRQLLGRNRCGAFLMCHFADHHREFLLRSVRGLAPSYSSFVPGTLTQGKGTDDRLMGRQERFGYPLLASPFSLPDHTFRTTAFSHSRIAIVITPMARMSRPSGRAMGAVPKSSCMNGANVKRSCAATTTAMAARTAGVPMAPVRLKDVR